jgi:hypothetical protein
LSFRAKRSAVEKSIPKNRREATSKIFTLQIYLWGYSFWQQYRRLHPITQKPPKISKNFIDKQPPLQYRAQQRSNVAEEHIRRKLTFGGAVKCTRASKMQILVGTRKISINTAQNPTALK